MCSFVFLELLLAIFTTLSRAPPQYFWDISNITCKLVLLLCFAQSLRVEKDLKARQILVFVAMIELVAQFVLGMIGLMNIHFRDDIQKWCLNKAMANNWYYD